MNAYHCVASTNEKLECYVSEDSFFAVVYTCGKTKGSVLLSEKNATQLRDQLNRFLGRNLKSTSVTTECPGKGIQLESLEDVEEAMKQSLEMLENMRLYGTINKPLNQKR